MAQDTKAVSEVIDRYLQAYVKRDVELLGTTLAQENETIGFGTDQGEYWKGWTTIRNVAEKQFAAFVEVDWKRGKPNYRYSRDGKVAWYCEEMAGEFMSAGGTKTECDIRFSAVLENRNGNWLITQFHRSVPVETHAVPYLETHGVMFD